ncbi:hypothetical protein AMK68_04075 [candidate division KD3-62 bacterium DG_56]|uniref:Zinc-ribbon domain-containing protein n=1 Tax=candidate division KD3-62 bacterium DG_56 TaxID=1704032 RepID=A0A0S7XN03_9BACT|nr:MAG: hypothetical protein AMK68_04075 [candidate division KD3-62 bacterium DG_56]
MAKKVTKKGAAGKRPAKAKRTQAQPVEPVADGVVTLEQFREAAKEYLRADENVRLYTKRRDAQKPTVRSYVDAHAVDLDKGKSRGLVDSAVKWLLVPGAAKVDDEAGVAALLAAISKATGDRKRVLQACLKQTVDREAWERAKAVGFIDDELAVKYEKGRSYALKWSHTDQISCHKCHAVATRTAKFCAACGADLSKQPDWLK